MKIAFFIALLFLASCMRIGGEGSMGVCGGEGSRCTTGACGDDEYSVISKCAAGNHCCAKIPEKERCESDGILCPDTLTCFKTNLTANGNGICIPKDLKPELYCEQDSDCVRQINCCDCGDGIWVNKEHLNNDLCADNMPHCKCAFRERIPVCVDRQCTSRAP